MKKIVIIGASSGIGRRMATDFARVGCRVGIAARRSEPLEEIRNLYPDNVAAMTIDVTAPDAVRRFYDLIELIDGMDIFINAAGIGFADPDLDDSRIASTLRTNVDGFARLTAAAYRYYRDTANVSRGQIAAITSIAGTKGIGIAAAYSASKRFQQSFIDALEQLAYQQQVNVAFTDIRPGFVDTPLLAGGRDYPMLMSVDKVAPLIETAILRQRRVYTVDYRWRAVNALWRMVPQRLWRHIGLHW
ncbi:MAG: SDR family NAD(P)-dependent oxidoreductase [Paramuribaculum sp.]|nr:SDR family NAD(P)-dependent oxidoreductase [Paramuribaculum sp.]